MKKLAILTLFCVATSSMGMEREILRLKREYQFHYPWKLEDKFWTLRYGIRKLTHRRTITPKDAPITKFILLKTYDLKHEVSQRKKEWEEKLDSMEQNPPKLTSGHYKIISAAVGTLLLPTTYVISKTLLNTFFNCSSKRRLEKIYSKNKKGLEWALKYDRRVKSEEEANSFFLAPVCSLVSSGLATWITYNVFQSRIKRYEKYKNEKSWLSRQLKKISMLKPELEKFSKDVKKIYSFLKTNFTKPETRAKENDKLNLLDITIKTVYN